MPHYALRNLATDLLARARAQAQAEGVPLSVMMVQLIERGLTASFRGRDLRQRRERLGLSQAQLGEQLEVAANTISRWEREELGIANPQRIDAMLRALEAVGSAPAPSRSADPRPTV